MINDNERIAINYLRRVPFSLCVRELNRLLAIEELDEKFNMSSLSPVLDVGCGDGFWWTLRKKKSRKIYGIDISKREVKQASKHIQSMVGDIALIRPFSEIYFQQIIGNCSLEHIRNIDLALQNIRSAADSNAKLILFVPAPQWAYQGFIQKFLLKYFPRISMMISGALNGFFQHWHLYEIPLWKKILEQNGWNVIDAFGIGNRRSEFLFRLFLPSSFASFLIKKLTGFYPNGLLRWCPKMILAPFYKLLLWSMRESRVRADSEYAYEYVILAEVKVCENQE